MVILSNVCWSLSSSSQSTSPPGRWLGHPVWFKVPWCCHRCNWCCFLTPLVFSASSSCLNHRNRVQVFIVHILFVFLIVLSHFFRCSCFTLCQHRLIFIYKFTSVMKVLSSFIFFFLCWFVDSFVCLLFFRLFLFYFVLLDRSFIRLLFLSILQLLLLKIKPLLSQ